MKFLLLDVTLFAHCYLAWGQAWDQDEDMTNPTLGAQNHWTYAYEGQRIQMHCPAGQVINVNKAFYGVVGPNDKNPICRDFAASTIMKSTCNGKQSCTPVMDNNLFPGTTCRTAHGTQFGSCSFWCSQSPCLGYYCANGGICEVSASFTPSCSCKGEWSGPRCEENPCDHRECFNNGKCIVDTQTGNAQCICKNGFHGKKCEIEFNRCQYNPCQNNGICVEQNDQVSCNCTGKWSGKFCTGSPCENHTCKNGGKCIVDSKTGLPSCACRCDYKGEFCEVDPCDSNPCQAGGTCTVVNDKVKCACAEYLAGEYCELPCTIAK